MRHTADCNWHRKHPGYRSIRADGVPCVLNRDPLTGATILEPCACWQARQEATP